MTEANPLDEAFKRICATEAPPQLDARGDVCRCHFQLGPPGNE